MSYPLFRVKTCYDCYDTKHVPKGTKQEVYFRTGAVAYSLLSYDK